MENKELEVLISEEIVEPVFEEKIEGTPDIPTPQEVNDDDIEKEKEEFANYMRKKYETPGI